MYQRTFYFHFKNLRFANSRNNTFLCYEVNGMECGELVPLYQGVFRKEVLGSEVQLSWWTVYLTCTESWV